MSDSEKKDDAYWRSVLSDEEYRICRDKGTEPAFSGEYWDCKKQGTYRCRCCGAALFDSGTKYDSGSGWPSFYAPIEESSIDENRDTSHGMIRTEIVCSACGCHLGHVFPDGPEPTGLRYCVNSASIKLESGQ